MAQQVSGGPVRLATATTEFAVKLHRAVAKTLRQDENMFYSPFSISTALAMTCLGAKEKTESEMKQALCFSEYPNQDLHPAFSSLLQGLNAPDSPYKLKTANRIYARQGHPFNQEFLDATKKFYEAQAKSVDFAGNPEGVKQEINQWVEEQTANKIKDLIPQIDSNLAMILINAIYFKGNWADKFDPQRTQKKPFQVSKTEQIETDFMFQKHDFQVGDSEELKCTVVGLPYEKGDLSFYIFVPQEIDGLAMLETNLKAEHLTDIQRKFVLRKNKVLLYLPKFKLEQSIQLNDTLTALGMSDVFQPRVADLSGIDGTRELYISKVLHKAFIEVNEEGTEAAAATAVMISCCCIQQPARVIVDRPFMFCIRDNRSGTILFMGRYCRPPTV